MEALRRVEFLRVRVEPGLSEAQALDELGTQRADVVLLLPAAAPGQPIRAELIDAISDPLGASVTLAAIRSVVESTNLALTGVPRAIELTSRSAKVERTTFFQFLGPGIIGMGLMNFETISLAASLSRYRAEGVLLLADMKLTQKPHTKRVKSGKQRHTALRALHKPMHALAHFAGGFIGKSNREDSPVWHPANAHQVSDTMGDHPGLATPRACQD